MKWICAVRIDVDACECERECVGWLRFVIYDHKKCCEMDWHGR